MENTLLIMARMLEEGWSLAYVASWLGVEEEWVELVVGSDAFLLLLSSGGTGNE